ncbi:MAG: SAM-dependent methyltransferase [Symploca sp. SIO2D2]|nr:SAM-dependent methyltransferase [Symploca sp. SIO2D2]
MGKAAVDSNEKLYEYLVSVSLRDSDLKRRLREQTAEMPQGGMQITPEQGQFMALLAQVMGAKKCLEIGTFTGYSALCVAEVLPEEGKIIALDCSAEWTDIARKYWEEAGVSDKIDLRIGSGRTLIDAIVDNGELDTFDMVFIDADKAAYDHYYEQSLKLLRSGGLILLDNMLWGGRVIKPWLQDEDTVAIRALNEKIRDDKRVDPCLTMIGDGLFMARKG